MKSLLSAIRLWLVERLGTCAAMAPIMSGSLDQRLGPVVWVKLQLHLAVCKWCRRYLEQMRLVQITARKPEAILESANSAGLSSDARRRIAEKLKAGLERPH